MSDEGTTDHAARPDETPAATPERRERLDALYARFTFDFVAREPYEHLHFGLWDEVPRRVDELARAQQAYADAVVALVPATAVRVLDVGCGLGSIARQLAERGATVTAIAPREDHIERLRAQPTAGIEPVASRFEDLAPDGPVDTVLFAESFAFIAPDAAAVGTTLARCDDWLSDEGRVVVADFMTAEVADALRGAAGYRVASERDVSDAVDFTFDALQERFERTVRPYHALLRAVLAETEPELAASLDQALAKVPSGALRQLFGGALADRAMAQDRRYLLLALDRT